MIYFFDGEFAYQLLRRLLRDPHLRSVVGNLIIKKRFIFLYTLFLNFPLANINAAKIILRVYTSRDVEPSRF